MSRQIGEEEHGTAAGRNKQAYSRDCEQWLEILTPAVSPDPEQDVNGSIERADSEGSAHKADACERYHCPANGAKKENRYGSDTAAHCREQEETPHPGWVLNPRNPEIGVIPELVREVLREEPGDDSQEEEVETEALEDQASKLHPSEGRKPIELFPSHWRASG